MKIGIGKFLFITVFIFTVIFMLVYIFTDLLIAQDYFVPLSPEKSQMATTFSVGDRILKMFILFLIAIVAASIFTMTYNRKSNREE